VDGKSSTTLTEFPKTLLDKITYKDEIVKGDHRSNYWYDSRGFNVLQNVPSVVENTNRYEEYTYLRDGVWDPHWAPVHYVERYTRHYAPDNYTPGQLGGFGQNPDDPYKGNVFASSLTKALNGLNKDSLQTGADLGEGRETLGMIASNASQIARALLAARQGNWGAIPGILGMNRRDVLNGKFLSNQWLQYQYGWKPLFGSLHDSVEKFMSPANPTPQLLISKGFAGHESTVTKNSLFDNSVSTLSIKQQAKTVLIAEIARPGLRKAAEWGLVNPASVAWELVPFSFVVDWFVPVGNVLSAATDTAGLTFKAGYSNTKTTNTWTYTGPSYSNSQSYSQNGRIRTDTQARSPAKYQEKSWSFSRIPLFGFPTPQFYAKTNPWSAPHIKNALALVRQLL
jgi:hypothetical protein